TSAALTCCLAKPSVQRAEPCSAPRTGAFEGSYPTWQLGRHVALRPFEPNATRVSTYRVVAGLVRGLPVVCRLGVHVDGYRKLYSGLSRLLHYVGDDGKRRDHIGLPGVEHQLVVNLQEHPHRGELRDLQGRRHPYHGTADDIGRGALDGGVDGRPLQEAAHRRVLGVDLGEMDAPPKDGLHE